MESPTVIDLQAREIRSQKAEIRRLRRALKAMVVDTEEEISDAIPSKASEESAVVPDSADEVEERGWSSGWSDESGEETKNDEPHEPFFDGEVYRCVVCGWEVVDGECALAGCGKNYVLPTQPEDVDVFQPLENLAVHPDRSLVPRGTTPVLSYRSLKDVEGPPSTYMTQFGPSRDSEYRDLRRRGATHLMCEKFRLSFTYETGIYALANPDLYEEFAGPKMKLGDTWMIHLGRRVQLDPDDLDGSAFIKGLLEDAIYFPLTHPLSKRDFEKWDTVEETPGVWVTKLVVHKTEEEIGEDDSDSESYLEDVERCKDADVTEEVLMKRGVDSDAEGGPLDTNEYESDSSFEEEEDDDGSEGSGPKEPPYDKLMDYYPGLTKHDDAWSAGEDDGEDRDLDPFGEGPYADVDSDDAASNVQSENSWFESARFTDDESRSPSPAASGSGSQM